MVIAKVKASDTDQVTELDIEKDEERTDHVDTYDEREDGLAVGSVEDIGKLTMRFLVQTFASLIPVHLVVWISAVYPRMITFLALCPLPNEFAAE